MNEEETVTLEAEPYPLDMDLKRTAVLVIDMQNTFVSPGGMFEMGGRDISHIRKTIEPNKRIIEAARNRGVKVIYAVHRISPDMREIGPMSRYRPHAWLKDPATLDKRILRGTWGTEIIDELKPLESEMVVEKRRFSAFSGTELDMTLNTYDIRYLIFTGVATNICVESSLRDASHLQYLPVLVSDATAASPPSRQESSIGNIRDVFGWVTTTEKVLDCLSGK